MSVATNIFNFVSSNPLGKAINCIMNKVFDTAGLAIKQSSSPDAKTVNTIGYSINGKLFTKTAIATVDLSELATVLATAEAMIVLILLDVSGNVSLIAGDAVASTAAATLGVPDYDPSTKCAIGAIKIVNATGSDFTVGTTALDASNTTVTFYELSGALPGQIL